MSVLRRIDHLLIAGLLLAAACSDRADVDRMHPDSTYTPANAPIGVDSGAALAISDSAQNDAQMIAPGNDSASIPEIDRFLIFGLKRIGSNRAEIAKVLGPADSTVSASVENRHMPGQIDSTHHVYYRDAEIDLYAMPTGGEMITAVKVKSNRLLRLPTVQIGMPWETVVPKITRPEESSATSIRHTCSVCEVEHELIVEGDGARVSSVTFTYWFD